MAARSILTVALIGCVENHDPEVFAVLPDVEVPCSTIGAAQARVAVETLEGERFEVASDTCGTITGTVEGFTLALERVTHGYHRATTTIVDANGSELGRVEQPFHADLPVVVPFSYADLPGWPTESLAIEIANCSAGSPRLSIRSKLATVPALDREVACGSVELPAPRGPIEILATMFGGGGCLVASAETFVVPVDPVFPTRPVALELVAGACP